MARENAAVRFIRVSVRSPYAVLRKCRTKKVKYNKRKPGLVAPRHKKRLKDPLEYEAKESQLVGRRVTPDERKKSSNL